MLTPQEIPGCQSYGWETNIRKSQVLEKEALIVTSYKTAARPTDAIGDPTNLQKDSGAISEFKSDKYLFYL